MQMSPPETTMAAVLDPAAHAAWARLSGSLSPESIRQALTDWASHLALSPGKQLDLAKLAGDEFIALTTYLRQGALAGPGAPRCAAPSPVRDRRFAAPADDLVEPQHFGIVQAQRQTQVLEAARGALVRAGGGRPAGRRDACRRCHVHGPCCLWRPALRRMLRTVSASTAPAETKHRGALS